MNNLVVSGCIRDYTAQLHGLQRTIIRIPDPYYTTRMTYGNVKAVFLAFVTSKDLSVLVGKLVLPCN